MEKIYFSFKNVKYTLKSHKLINFIIIITMSVGMMFLLVTCVITSQIFENMRICNNEDIDKRAVIDFYIVYQDAELVDKQIFGISEDIDNIGYITYYKATINWKDNNYVVGLCGYSDNYLTLEGYKLIEGKLPVKEEIDRNDKVCLIKSGGKLENDGINIGNKISILGEEYTILGIVNVPRAYGEILLPYDILGNFIGNNAIQYRVTINTKEKSNIAEIKENLDFATNIIDVTSAKENNDAYYHSIIVNILDRMKMALLVLGFAVISMAMIVVGKTLENQYYVGIILAVGATRRQVLLEIFIENALLVMVAGIIDIVLLPGIISHSQIVTGYPNIWVFITFMGIELAIALLISEVVVHFLLRGRNIINLLRRSK